MGYFHIVDFGTWKINGIWNIIAYEWDIDGILVRYNGFSWGFPWSWRYPELAGWFCQGKSPSKIDDDWGIPPILGTPPK